MKTIFAAAFAVSLAAAPAFAAEEYQTGPALNLNDHVVAMDTGSAQYPHFDGQATVAQSETIVVPNASEASVESTNSLPVPFARSARVSRLAQR
jgi:hypothetical protein